jgi:hypothetical protein
MNKRFTYWFIAALLIAAGCKKSELTSYTQPDMIYIYKEAFNIKKDSATSSFAIKSNTLIIDTVKVSVRIMGVATTTDRVVKLAPVAASSTAVQGTHYELLPYVIKAGTYNADLPVVIKRTADMKTQEFRLVLELQQTADFNPGVPNSPVAGNFAGASLQYLIKMNDFLTKPSNWDSQLTSYFGTFSQIKFKFIIDNTGKTEFILGAPPATSIGEMQYFKALCKSRLIDHISLYGPLIDEFGLPVTFP